jgi:23S rRNA (adenine2503-C2)-methyltransferase
LNALLPSDEHLTHLVVMGIGEPLLNLEALLPALDDITDSLGISVRRVTISTVGIPTGIRKLAVTAKTGKSYRLAISLHASDDELRSTLIPQNRLSGIADILRVTDEYFEQTGRRVTFEYTLIGGVNDQVKHAKQLVALLKGRTAVVNIITLNPVQGKEFRPPSVKVLRRFVEELEAGGQQVSVRFRKGDKIAAACGQLRRLR